MKLLKMKTWISLFIMVYIAACNSDISVPKPPVFPRIMYPEKAYDTIKEGLPYAFEKPIYSQLRGTRESTYPKNEDMKFWRNLYFKPFDATLHISYSSVSSLNELDSMREDTRKLAFKHSFRADDIQAIGLSKAADKVYGVMYLIEGNTATNLNFYLTDSTRNFIRGALYFNQKTQPDSILPVFKFIKQDIEHLINTFQWR